MRLLLARSGALPPRAGAETTVVSREHQSHCGERTWADGLFPRQGSVSGINFRRKSQPFVGNLMRQRAGRDAPVQNAGVHGIACLSESGTGKRTYRFNPDSSRAGDARCTYCLFNNLLQVLLAHVVAVLGPATRINERLGRLSLSAWRPFRSINRRL